jgi:hypothetical protein
VSAEGGRGRDERPLIGSVAINIAPIHPPHSTAPHRHLKPPHHTCHHHLFFSLQAVAVAQTAINERLARNLSPADFPFLEGIIQRRMYDPLYVPLIPTA